MQLADQIRNNTVLKEKFSCSLSTVVGWSQLRSRKDEFRPFFFDVESDENSFIEVFKIPKTKGISFNEFNKIIRCFQFGVGIG